MEPRKPPPEGPAKGEESDDASPSMDRFKSLTKGLLGVPRDELADEQRRYESERKKPN